MLISFLFFSSFFSFSSTPSLSFFFFILSSLSPSLHPSFFFFLLYWQETSENGRFCDFFFLCMYSFRLRSWDQSIKNWISREDNSTLLFTLVSTFLFNLDWSCNFRTEAISSLCVQLGIKDPVKSGSFEHDMTSPLWRVLSDANIKYLEIKGVFSIRSSQSFPDL